MALCSGLFRLQNVLRRFSALFSGDCCFDGFRIVAQGLSAKTKLYFYPNAFVREFIGLLYEQRYRHIVAMVILANVFAFMMLTIFY